MSLFHPLKHFKNLKRLGAKGLQPSDQMSSLSVTKELTATLPEETASLKDVSLHLSYYLKQLFGFRTLKTGLAIFSALLLSELPLISNPFYVVMGTVFALQSTVKDSFTVGKERLLGTLIGGCLGFLFACLPWQNFVLIAFAAILTIVVCNQTANAKAISLSLTICLSILISIEDQHPLLYSFFRMTDTAIGLSVGILVNYFVARPDYKKPLIQLFHYVYQQSLDWYLTLLVHQSFDLNESKQQLHLVDDLSKKYLEDTVNPTLQSQTIIQLVDTIHDLRFHLKGLFVCLDEGHSLDSSDKTTLVQELSQLIQQPQQSVSLPTAINSSPLVAYHVEKVNGYLLQIQEDLTSINTK